MTKTYVVFGNDHSQSMGLLARAALNDYNTNITAIKDAATREMQDTIVSVISFGKNRGAVDRDIVISNPHVLKPMAKWEANANTPLWDAVGNGIELIESLPDYSSKDVAFLFIFTTDGEEYGSTKYNQRTIADKIKQLNSQERWTFVFRVPKGSRSVFVGMGIPDGNIQEWETTELGMQQSTKATTQAVDKFYAARSAGQNTSTVFYADASDISKKDIKASLKDISAEIKLYVVGSWENGIEIKPFLEQFVSSMLKGAAFYQLTKTESRVQENKLILIRDRVTGKVYAGKDARTMIGLPTTGTVRLHPGDHGNFDLFIQSTSVNRKLVGNTGVIYWPSVGVPFTPEDTAYLNGPVTKAIAKVKPVAPAVVQLPAVPVSTKPTKSPIAPTPTPKAVYFPNRKIARATGMRVFDAGDQAAPGKRWFVLN